MVSFQSQRSIERRILGVITLYSAVIMLGTAGYRILEEWGWLDSLYMTMITITTVGFGEIHELSRASRVFTIVLILLGVGSFTYTFGTIADYLIAGQLKEFLIHRRMKIMIKEMKDHQIVCGFGRVGFQVVYELKRAGKPFVVIDEESKAAHQAMDAGHATIEGNANNDDVLRNAGVERASSLVATLGTDAANLMLVLSARALNKELFIVARANFMDAEKKLITAGANRVISPYSISGRRMAHMLIRPNIVDFLDVVMHDEEMELEMEDVAIANGSKLDGCAIGEARISETTGANILGLKRSEGQVIASPAADTVLKAKDILIALGTRNQLTKLQSLSS